MRLKKLLFILITSTITGLVIHSCCEGYYYKWTYIITENMDSKQVSSLDSISKENFGIKVHLINRKYSSNSQGFLINGAYATDCYEIYLKEDSIISIEIISVNRFNLEKDSLSNVSEYFLGQSEFVHFADIHPIADFISIVNEEVYQPIDNINLVLNTDQIFDALHQFIIRIELSDHRFLVDTTSTVRIY